MWQTRSLSLSCALTVLFALTAPTFAASPAPSTAPAQSVAVVRLEGKIDDYNARHFMKRFKQAQATGAKTIIIDIDTYGGLVTAGLDISRFIKGQTDVRTVAFVGQKAISAGAMIALACDEIVMAPSAQMGDCAPISVGEDGRVQTMGKDERAKAVSPIDADFLNSATTNGYDALLTAAMVRSDITVHWIENEAGERRFVDQPEFEQLSKQGWKSVKDPAVRAPVDGPDTLLTVSGEQALKLGLAKAEHATIPSLASARNYTITASFGPAAGDKIIEWLTHPLLRMLLMIVFVQAVYAAMHAPGHGFAEVLAVVVLAILVGVPLMTGYAQWWEIVVILVGIALLSLEIFVIPGFGFAGIIGIVMLLFGLLMTFVGTEPATPGVLPQLDGTWKSLRSGLAAVVGAMVASIFVAMWLRRFLPSIPYFKRLILTNVAGGGAVVDGNSMSFDLSDQFKPAVGAFGEAITDLRPGGTVSFYDPSIADVRIVSVTSATGFVSRGAKVTVIENDHNRIRVRPRSADE